MKRHSARSGFSLIEILVVVTIMGIIMAYLVSTIGSTGATARAASTKTTIAKLDSILKQRIDAFYKKPLKNEAKLFASAYAAGGNNPSTIPDRVAEVFVRKLVFRSEFPQRLEDLYGVDGAPNTADDAYLLSVWLAKTGGVLFPPGHDRKHESSKLLYLALMEKQDEMTDSINPRHVAYLDPNDKTMGLGAYVDDWGKALRFYNAPTRLVRPGGDWSDINTDTLRDTATPLIAVDWMYEWTPPSPGVRQRVLTIPFREPAQPPQPLPPTSPETDKYELNQDSDDPARYFVLARYRSIYQGTGPNYLAAAFGLAQWIPAYRRSSANTASYPYVSGSSQPFNESTFHGLGTYHRPLILSIGEDEDSGLVEPTFSGPERNGQPVLPLNIESIADNITNLQGKI